MSDARFEDGADRPLKLWATDAQDLQVVSALVQDAVLSVAEMRFDPKARRFAALLNRFRWEDRDRAAKAADFERVQTLLVVRDVGAVASQGFGRGDRDLVLSLLALEFQPLQDGAGALVLRLAGDGDIRLSVDCLDVTLRDVSRPYVAPTGKAPAHDLGDN
jgi:hypothetical protein